MTEIKTIESILQDSGHDLGLFSKEAVSALENRAFQKTPNSKWLVKCIVRGKDVQLKPEEVVRQLYAERLMEEYKYPPSRLAFEFPVTMGSSKKSADIVVLDEDRLDTPSIIIEVKKPKSKDGIDQLKSYCNATGAPMGVWTNGDKIEHYRRVEPNVFLSIGNIPRADQQLKDVLSDRFTLKTLFLEDRLINERKSLIDIIKDMENNVLANAGVDVFEEAFKLIFTKLYDESRSWEDKRDIEKAFNSLDEKDRANFEKRKKCLEDVKDDDFRLMEFINTGQTGKQLEKKIQDLFDRAQKHWRGVFEKGSKITLKDSHLDICVSELHNVKLFNSNLMVIDEAFEYLVNKSSKGEKGQYFTPRHVIDMCVIMLNPKKDDYMIDTAAGSCGFPVHTIFKKINRLFTNETISEEERKHVRKVFGIDFDEKVVRVARTLNLIAGDGETNVLHLNTLDFRRWDDKTENDREWQRIYDKGFERLEDLRVEDGQNKYFKFDIVMANPPFAGDIKEARIVNQYDISTKPGQARPQGKVARDILFIERNLDFLKPGGRMAIVLPQGRFNNSSDKYIREFIAKRCRILAVVGLHGNTFKPHTGTKTSVLFVQKWDDKLCPELEDYDIFFATSKKGGKNNSGEYIYVKNGEKQNELDKNDHLIVEHDLHNHGGVLKEDGIAEAFIDWGKREGLSFLEDEPGKF